ncbi:MAG TPA: hypothetical protein VNA25_23580 [Phycisphaerae bacterium]|nr:hypothetical protein [Phycisphaerae bacterium]
MNERVEGTIVLDGIIEGKLTPQPNAEARLQDWIDNTAAPNLKFSLSIEGNSFSLLADDRPILAEVLGASPARTIEQRLQELLDILPEQLRRSASSTLRSTEYRKGKEIQTLYAIGPDGRFHSAQRIIEAKTTPAPQPMSLKDKLRFGALGLGVALVILAVSSIFVDYRELVENVIEGFTPLNPEGLKVEADRFSPYFNVVKKEAASGGKEAVLTVRRTAAFPKTDAECDRLLNDPNMSLPQRLAVEALAHGYVRCEYFDRKNGFRGFTIHRVSELRQKEATTLVLPIPRKPCPDRIVITY